MVVLAVKRQPNDRHISMQHIATLLGTACCMHLATLLWWVVMCWDLLGVVGLSLKMVKFFIQHLWILQVIVLVWPGSCKTSVLQNMCTSLICNTQHIAWCHNRVAKCMQHVVPNNVAISCINLCQMFSQGVQILGQQFLQYFGTVASWLVC